MHTELFSGLVYKCVGQGTCREYGRASPDTSLITDRCLALIARIRGELTVVEHSLRSFGRSEFEARISLGMDKHPWFGLRLGDDLQRAIWSFRLSRKMIPETASPTISVSE